MMFGVADYGAFVVAVIVFLAIPGPGNLALITSTGKGGLAGGLAATLGVIVGDQVWQLAPTAEGNKIVVAARGVEVPAREVLVERAQAIEARYALPATKWLRMVRPWRPAKAAAR